MESQLEVQIISEDCIKPSSPTLSNLKAQYNVSLLDQFIGLIDFPMVLYYSNQSKSLISNRSSLLKQSLSQTLPQFFPLAGRIAKDYSVECNDEGVLYLDAKANISLSEFLKKPDLNSIYKLLPDKSPAYVPIPGSYVTMIQETTFICGGTAIGINVLHLVIDGCGLSSFLKAWAAMAYKSIKIYPNFDGSLIFPKQDDFPEDATIMSVWKNFVKIGTMHVRKFVFDGSSIAKLKVKAISSGVKNPTRVEVVSALLCKCLMSAFNSKSGNDLKPLAITHAVNLRPKAVPPLPECSMGNYVCLADAILSPEEKEISNLVQQMKEAIQKIDNEFVKNIKGDGGFRKFYERIREINGNFSSLEFSNGLDYVQLTSWCGFGHYEVDFGFGKPIWISCAGSYGNFNGPYMNYIVLTDGKINNGIEAWVVLDEDTIVMLEKNEELLENAHLNMSPM